MAAHMRLPWPHLRTDVVAKVEDSKEARPAIATVVGAEVGQLPMHFYIYPGDSFRQDYSQCQRPVT